MLCKYRSLPIEATCLWYCTQPHTCLSGYLIKAAQPQSNTERQGLDGEEEGEEGWKIQMTQIVAGCSQGCSQESLSLCVLAGKPPSWVNIITAFDWRGWLPRGHGMQRKSQLRNLYITVLRKSIPNTTLQFDSLAIRIGEMGMKIAASDELTASILTCRFVNTNSPSTEITNYCLQLLRDHL